MQGGMRGQGRDILYLTECYRLKDSDLVHFTDEETEAGPGERGLPELWAVAWGLQVRNWVGNLVNGDDAGDTTHSGLSLARSSHPVPAHPNICP